MDVSRDVGILEEPKYVVFGADQSKAAEGAIPAQYTAWTLLQSKLVPIGEAKEYVRQQLRSYPNRRFLLLRAAIILRGQTPRLIESDFLNPDSEVLEGK